MTKRSTSRLAAVAMERRNMAADAGISGRHFTGHAAVFNQRTAIGDPTRWGFYEIVAPGAFDKTLRESDVAMLADHDPAKPLGWTSGALSVSVDARGVAVDLPDIPATTYGNDLVINLENDNVRGMSFGFQCVQDDWTTERQTTNAGLEVEVEVRTLIEVRLIEVSTTAFPAYAGTDASVRAVRAAMQSRHVRGGIAPWTYDRTATLRAKAVEELRVGATLSTETLATLQDVLDLVSAADDNVDEAQVVLSALMGVPNPDNDDAGQGSDAEDEEEAERAAAEWERRRRWLKLEQLRAG